MSNYELRHVTEQEAENDQSPASKERQNSSDQMPDVMMVGSPNGKLLLDENGQPVDQYKIVFFILLLHGIGTLMPWNMFINAGDYFRKYKLSPINTTDTDFHMDISKEELEELRKNFLFYLGLAAQIPNVLFNGLNLVVNMGSGNLKLRVNITLAIEAVIFLITIILAVVDSSRWPGAFFYITMVSVLFLNMASGIYQNCIFGTGAKFPCNYTNAILIGSNFSGTFTSTINLLSIWLAPEPQEAAMYYFITALFIILVCLISYNMLPMNPFFKHYDASSSAKPEQLEIASAVENQLANNDIANNSDIPDSMRRTVEAMYPRPNINPTFTEELTRKFEIFKLCWPQCLNVFLIFFITLALFPQVMANIERKQNFLSDKYFAAFACFYIFNVFAMLGNLMSSWTTWPGRHRAWILVVARILFVPFFLYCNFNPKSRKWRVLINNDTVYMCGNVLFALSSGYLSSLCMMFASSNLRPEDAPSGGMLAAFFLVLGIFVGIYSSSLLTSIVEL